MILHVCERAAESDAAKIVVATDDQRVFETVTFAGFEAIMTRAEHTSGTDRMAEVADKLGWVDSEIIVNLQGDEPLIPPELINETAEMLRDQQTAQVSTLATPIRNVTEIFDPNVVKVVTNSEGYALYFSRASIPWDREHFHNDGSGTVEHEASYLRHIGIYGYTAGFLKRFIDWPVSQLETIERLEQLRILWNGEPIRVKTVEQLPETGVDTESDLIRVENLMENHFRTGHLKR